MNPSTSILICGRARDHVAALAGALRPIADLDLSTRVIVNGHTDPLYNVDPLPEILVLDLGASWQDELQALMQRQYQSALALIVVSSVDDPRVMRMAMQAGARDFLTHPVNDLELCELVKSIAAEAKTREHGQGGRITVVTNATGGAGASFIACNLAHLLATRMRARVCLLDLDFQFGTLPLYLDLEPGEGLLGAIALGQELDNTALQGHVRKHKSGVHLLGTDPEYCPPTWDIHDQSLARVLDVTQESYGHVVADMPRHLDPMTSLLLERADDILLVMQQSLMGLRDAKKWLRIMKRDLGLAEARIRVVINRYEPNSEIELKNIQDGLACESIGVIPNDYRRVTQAISAGLPLLEYDEKCAVSKAMVKLAGDVGGTAVDYGDTFLRKIFGRWLPG